MLGLVAPPLFRNNTPLTASYTGSYGASVGSSPYSSSAIAIGAADTERYVLVAVVLWATNATISSVTIGGISATAVGTLASFLSGGNHNKIQFYIAKVPTGTTAVVVVTTSITIDRLGILAWRLMGLQSVTPVDEAEAGNADPMTAAIDAPGGGAIFGAAMVPLGTTFTWTNLTEDVDAVQMGASNRIMSGAHTEYASGSANVSVTADQASNSPPAAMKLVALR